MIELVGVTHHYGVRPVLRDVDMWIETGELVTVLGPNGMDKTTLLGVIAGVLDPRKDRAAAPSKMGWPSASGLFICPTASRSSATAGRRFARRPTNCASGPARLARWSKLCRS